LVLTALGQAEVAESWIAKSLVIEAAMVFVLALFIGFPADQSR
jgi:hypothetical protein